MEKETKQRIKLFKTFILLILCLIQIISGLLNQNNCIIQPNISKWLIINGFLMILLHTFTINKTYIKRSILIIWKVSGKYNLKFRKSHS